MLLHVAPLSSRHSNKPAALVDCNPPGYVQIYTNLDLEVNFE